MRYTIATAFALASVVGLLPFGAAAIDVNCNAPSGSIQAAVDAANGPTIISIKGVCEENVLLTKDDITLSGKKGGSECHKDDPSVSAGATIDGTITVDGVRATIEFLEITGSGAGVRVTNRADARLTCNDISSNDASGVVVLRASNAVLRDNTLSSNGQQGINEPFVFFDVGLFAADASSVLSLGNTYSDNQYGALDIDRQASFRNGRFLPRKAGGGPADPNETDIYTEKGCIPGTGAGCFTSDFGPIAIGVFNDGLVDLRNFQINGEVNVGVDSSFRLDANGTMQGNIDNSTLSLVGIRNRKALFGDRQVTFKGTLFCSGNSQTFGDAVLCGETCDVIIRGDTLPNTCAP